MVPTLPADHDDCSHQDMQCMSVCTNTTRTGILIEDSVVPGLSNDVAGVILGGYLGLAHEYKLARVCRRWADFLRSPQYTTHVTLAVSDWTFNALLCDVIRECEDNKYDSCTVDTIHGRAFDGFLKRVSGHRGPIVLQTNFLRPGRSDAHADHFMAYVNVVFSVLNKIENVAAFSMHDTSLATDVHEFLNREEEQENAHSEHLDGSRTSVLPAVVHPWSHARAVLSTGLASRIRNIVTASCVTLDRLSLRGALLGHALAPPPKDKIVLQSARYICVPTCVLDWVVCPGIQCFHNLKNSSFTSVFRFLRYHSRLLTCVTLNLHSIRGQVVNETAFNDALDVGFAFDALAPPHQIVVGGNESTPQCSSGCSHPLQSLHHTTTGDDLHCVCDSEKQSTAVDLAVSRGTQHPSPLIFQVNLENLSSIHIQSTQRGLTLRILDFLRCPRVRHVKIATVGEPSSLEGSLRMRESFDRVMNFLHRNGRRVESLHLSLRSFGKVMASASDSFSLEFPRLHSANVSTEFFYHFLSQPNAAPQLSALSLNGFPAAARARRSNSGVSSGNDAPTVADSSSVVALLNARPKLKTLVLEPHCAEYSDLQYTQHLKISGWTNHERLVRFKHLPAMQTFTSTCAIPWRYLVNMLGAAANLHSVFVFGGIFGIDFDDPQNEILTAHTSWQYFAGTFEDETTMFLRKLYFEEVHSHVGICESQFRVFRRRNIPRPEMLDDKLVDAAYNGATWQVDGYHRKEKAEWLDGERNATDEKAAQSVCQVVADVFRDSVLKEVSTQMRHVVPQWLLLCDSILGLENPPRSLGCMLENLGV
eukprot:Lankesteria_metandrocarpae@DN1480_c0_g1_i1.p1